MIKKNSINNKKNSLPLRSIFFLPALKALKTSKMKKMKKIKRETFGDFKINIESECCV